MLGSIGFIAAGIFFGVFAFTFEALVASKTSLRIKQFGYAFYSLSTAFIIWGIACALNSQNFLSISVLIGNSLLLLGTILLLDLIVSNNQRNKIIPLATIIAVVLVTARAIFYYPQPYMKDGVLVLNTQSSVAAVLMIIILSIWLPVCVRVAKQVTHSIKHDSIAPLYTGIYVLTALSAMIFISAKRPQVVILSFAAITVCFAMLLSSNLLISKLVGSDGRSQ